MEHKYRKYNYEYRKLKCFYFVGEMGSCWVALTGLVFDHPLVQAGSNSQESSCLNLPVLRLQTCVTHPAEINHCLYEIQI